MKIIHNKLIKYDESSVQIHYLKKLNDYLLKNNYKYLPIFEHDSINISVLMKFCHSVELFK